MILFMFTTILPQHEYDKAGVFSSVASILSLESFIALASQQSEAQEYQIKIEKPSEVAADVQNNIIYVSHGPPPNSIQVITGSNNEKLNSIEVNRKDMPFDINVSPNTNKIYVDNIDNRSIDIIEDSTYSLIAKVQYGDILPLQLYFN